MTKKHKSITADVLMKRRVGETSFIVDGVLPTGLAILGGAPKARKSWLCQSLATSVATGSTFLGKLPTQKTGVVYLCLEDNVRRLQSRLKLVLQGQPPPPNLHYHLQWPKHSEGGFEQLKDWVDEQDDIGLVIIDTLGRFRGVTRGRGDIFTADYEFAAGIKAWADKTSRCVLLVHHLRKAGSSDPFAQFSGSTGLTAAADVLFHLHRDRGSDDATLTVSGRDIEERAIELTFVQDRGRFEVQGDARPIFLSPERKRILAFIEASSVPVRAITISRALDQCYSSTRKLIAKMIYGGVLEKTVGGYRSTTAKQPKKKDQTGTGAPEQAGALGALGALDDPASASSTTSGDLAPVVSLADFLTSRTADDDDRIVH